MTVESLQTKEIYEGNGAATEFPVPFSYNQTDTLKLIFTSAAGEDVEVTENFRVNVSGDGDTSITYPLEGDPIPAGTRLTIYRQTPLTQVVDLIYGGAFNPDVLEHDALDRAVLMIQELSERTDRSLQWPITMNPGDMESPGEYLAQVNAARDVAVSAAGSAGASASDSASSAGASGASASAAAASAAEARDIAENFTEHIPLVDDTHNGAMPKFNNAPQGSLPYVGTDGIEYGSLLPRPATQAEVNTGEVDPEQPEWTQPFVGVGELIHFHNTIHQMKRLVFTKSTDTFTFEKDATFIAALINGGQGGGNLAGGNTGGILLTPTFIARKDDMITCTIGGGGAGAAYDTFGNNPGAAGGVTTLNINGNYRINSSNSTLTYLAEATGGAANDTTSYVQSYQYGKKTTAIINDFIAGEPGLPSGNAGHSRSRPGSAGGGGYILSDYDFIPKAGNGANGAWASAGTGGQGFSAGGGSGCFDADNNSYRAGGAGAQGCIVIWYWDLI